MRTSAKHFIESVLIFGDQLLPHHPLLDPAQSHQRSVVMIESFSRMRERRYHKHKNEWFLESYVDAYDWVVTPNVIGMGLYADGGVVGAKPYIASAAYINKMSDYCGGCRYDAKQRTGETACPFNALYWNFLQRYEKQLRANPRMGPNVLGLKHLDEAERLRVQQQANEFLEKL